MFNFLENPFVVSALIASLIASISSGVIGSFVVIKRISFIAGSISHSILGGMGLCLWLQKAKGLSFFDPILGAFFFALLSALLLGWIHLHYKEREDALIAAIWSTGMSIGIIFLSLTPGNSGDLLNYLFGNILFINSKDLYSLLFLSCLVLLVVRLYYRKFLALCFDEEQALLEKVAVQKLYLLLLSLVAISVVLLMQVIGVVLVIALLTIPATLANLFTHRLWIMMLFASGFCALLSFLGIWVSFILDFPSGATIALLSALVYFLLVPIKKKKFFLQKRSRKIQLTKSSFFK